jgi:hypothetical protein
VIIRKGEVFEATGGRGYACNEHGGHAEAREHEQGETLAERFDGVSGFDRVMATSAKFAEQEQQMREALGL